MALKLGLKHYEDDVDYVPNYIFSVLIYYFISIVLVVIYIRAYFNSVNDSPGYNSGIYFLLLGLIINFSIKLFYKIVINAVDKMRKEKRIYILKNHEMNWTILIICLFLFVYFLSIKSFTYGLSYLSIFLSHFIWIDISKECFHKKFEEFKSLTVSYWGGVAYILIGIFAYFRYSSGTELIAAYIGIGIGLLLGIGLMYYIYKREKSKVEVQKSLDESQGLYDSLMQKYFE